MRECYGTLAVSMDTYASDERESGEIREATKLDIVLAWSFTSLLALCALGTFRYIWMGFTCILFAESPIFVPGLSITYLIAFKGAPMHAQRVAQAEKTEAASERVGAQCCLPKRG